MIWVLIDISYLGYRAFHTTGHLEHDDTATGVLFGFFQQLRQICQDPRIQSNRVAIFCDSKKSYRAKAYPTYKCHRHRDKTPEEINQIRAMKSQLRRLQSTILPSVGFPVHRQAGLESDDLIAQAAKTLSSGPEKACQAVIVTADGDLYQSITDQVHWFDPRRNLYHTPETFKATQGVIPQQWGEVKALAGCHTDDVKGIPGVGTKTAVKFLRRELAPKLKTHQRIISPESQEILERNRGLVVLPHKRTKPVVLREPKYDFDTFEAMCRVNGLTGFLHEGANWLSFFRGTCFQRRRKREGFGL